MRRPGDPVHIQLAEGQLQLLGDGAALARRDHRDLVSAAAPVRLPMAPEGIEMTGARAERGSRNACHRLETLQRSFVAQGVDGVQPRRLPGGVITEGDADRHRDGHGDDRGVQRGLRWASPRRR